MSTFTKEHAAALIKARFDDESLGFVQERVAARIGVTPAQLWQWTTGYRPVPAQHAEILAAEIGMRPEDVSPAYRKQAARSAQVAAVVASNLGAADNDWVQVKFYPTAAASAGGGAANQGAELMSVPLLFRRRSLENRGINPDSAVCVPVRGDSMAGYIEHGDVIMYDTAKRAVVDGDIYVCRLGNGDGEEIVKRLYRVPGRRLLVKSDNPAHPPYEASEELGEITVLGRVEWIAGWTKPAEVR